jgi:hypothetical protein
MPAAGPAGIAWAKPGDSEMDCDQEDPDGMASSAAVTPVVINFKPVGMVLSS